MQTLWDRAVSTDPVYRASHAAVHRGDRSLPDELESWTTKPYAVHDFLTYPEASSWLPGSDLNAIQHMQGDLIASGFNELCYQDSKCPIVPWAMKLRLQECGHMIPPRRHHMGL
ncbi:hypothetical protein E4U57_005894 [Claviceps arundinis]|uniref:Uncharacterized protein n=1 Tax=Claviceps arundinis TaxID=1623583 RepID=A0ABQ7P4N3_9HYPO|nr:hypothetical protein E4U57_005894 [Claviceps arundinis]